MELKIRQEDRGDFEEVYELISLAFGRINEARLVASLRKNNAFIPNLSLVAVIDNKVAGYVLFTRIKIKSDSGNENESLALAPLAVRPGFQKQRIGAQLIMEGLCAAREFGYKSVIVLGHKDYYPRFGFLPADRWGIKSPYNVPANVFMGIELIKDGLKDVTGTVMYPEEFKEL